MKLHDMFAKLQGASPLTSLGGLIYVVGFIVELVNPTLGEVLKTAGVALVGLAARDNNVTSREAGAE